jgi:hypothetical protein
VIFRCFRNIAKSDYQLCHAARLSVRLLAAILLPLDGFSWNLALELFSNICREKSTYIKIWPECHVLYTNAFMIISGSVLLRMRNVSDKGFEKIKTHILCSVTNFRKSYRIWDNDEQYSRAGQAADGNMAHAHCMLDTKGCKHTLIICNTYCFPTATIVSWARFNVTETS